MPADPLQNRNRIQSLVESFRARLPKLRGECTTEAQIRLEFLDRFWEALGWDVRNKGGKSEAEKDVVIEGRVGPQLKFDPDQEHIFDDENAGTLVRREYRNGPWAVPKGV